MSYTTIANQLKTLLDQISDLAEVYDHAPKQLDTFPCATISAVAHDNVFNDTAGNKRTYTFIVRIFTRTDVAADAERIIRSLADQVITKLESDVTLLGSCDIATPTKGRFQFIEREVPLIACEITVEAKKRILR